MDIQRAKTLCLLSSLAYRIGRRRGCPAPPAWVTCPIREVSAGPKPQRSVALAIIRRRGCMPIPAGQAEDRGQQGARSWTGMDDAGWHTMRHTTQPKVIQYWGPSRGYAQARRRTLDAGAMAVGLPHRLCTPAVRRASRDSRPSSLKGQARRRRRRRRTVAPPPPPDMLRSAHDASPGWTETASIRRPPMAEEIWINGRLTDG